MTVEGKRAALEFVLRELHLHNWDKVDLARETGLDAGTVGDLLAGKRWPRIKTLGKIEAALECSPGMLQAIAEERQAAPKADEYPFVTAKEGASTGSLSDVEESILEQKIREGLAAMEELRRRHAR